MLIDNCPAHPPVEKLQTDDGNIVAYFFPPNVTAAIQPMDLNPIRLTKLKYRNKLLANLIAENDIAIHDYLKQHSLRDAIILLKQAWDEVSASTIEKSFSKLNNWDTDKFDEEDELPLSEWNSLQSEYDRVLEETRSLLDIIAPGIDVNIDEVEHWNTDTFVEESNENEQPDAEESLDCNDDDVIYETPNISYSKAIESVNNLIKWCEKSDVHSTKQLPNLLSIRADIVLAQLNNPKKQTTMTDFITKS